MSPKVPPKVVSPTKPLESSTMTLEEREEIFHQIGKVENKMDGVENKMDENMKEMEIKMDENMKEMENKMDENREHMEKKMLELQNSMSSIILRALDEGLPIGDIKMKGNH
jgi:predicted phage-related endonuclease